MVAELAGIVFVLFGSHAYGLIQQLGAVSRFEVAYVMMVNTSCGSIVTLTIGLLEALLEAVEEYLRLQNSTVLMTQAVNGHTMKWDHPIHS